ncbi:synaptonemal complex central element protein 2 [Mantella aurantiaca]
MADTEHRENPEESGAPAVGKSSPAPLQTSSRCPSPPVPGPSGDSSNTTAGRSEGKSPGYFAELDAVVEALQIRAQSLIDKINEKRGKDQTVMEDFKTSFNLKVKDLCQCLEERMYQLYEQNNIHLQAKVQELTDVIERIGHLQEELRQVCHTLTTVYKNMGLQPDM